MSPTPDTNYFVLSDDYFLGVVSSFNHYAPPWLKDLLTAKASAAEVACLTAAREDLSTEASFPKQLLYSSGCGGTAAADQPSALLSQPQQRPRDPATTTSLPNERDYYIEAKRTPSTKRIIFKEDLLKTLRYLESQNVYFHNARLGTVYLEEEQKQPSQYFNDQYFVVSKVAVSKADNKYDMTTKQVFH